MYSKHKLSGLCYLHCNRFSSAAYEVVDYIRIVSELADHERNRSLRVARFTYRQKY